VQTRPTRRRQIERLAEPSSSWSSPQVPVASAGRALTTIVGIASQPEQTSAHYSVAVVQMRFVHHATFVVGRWGRLATVVSRSVVVTDCRDELILYLDFFHNALAGARELKREPGALMLPQNLPFHPTSPPPPIDLLVRSNYVSIRLLHWYCTSLPGYKTTDRGQ
jgi:hypothetical protein